MFFKTLWCAALLAPVLCAADGALHITIPAKGKAISPHLFGVFFEDLNYAADGGLYAELVRNRSFEYTSADRKTWHALTGWGLVKPEDAAAALSVESAQPLHVNNKHYAVLEVRTANAEAGLRNYGFDGIAVRAGEQFDLALFARVLEGEPRGMRVRLENSLGLVLAEAGLAAPAAEWRRYTASLTAAKAANDARLVITVKGRAKIAFDVVSLFPRNTFRGRANGLRPDLAEAIAALKPRFVRFPGGCLVHGDGLDNMYRWKNTVGPIEQRVEQANIWDYHQSVGLGYFEYFQFCEDIGAKPLPVVAAAVSCQNSGARVTGKWGQGQTALPMSALPDYVQEVLDLIEYANGPAASKWGAVRAAAGHAAPFGLRYIGLGNEDAQTDAFRERFKVIHDAVKARHPEITVIGTVGPFADGEDFDAGWKFANQERLAMVDEHYYKPPKWFLENVKRYDAYSRTASKVYVGEYAAHDEKKRSTLWAALAEAAFMTGLERNGDVVSLASYAPLLARTDHINWRPDLLYFTRTEVRPTFSYWVQHMFGRNAGDEYLPAKMDDAEGFAFSAVRDSATGGIVLKMVNTTNAARAVQCALPRRAAAADGVVLAGEAHSDAAQPPREIRVPADWSIHYTAPPHSFTVLRIR